MTDRSQIPTTIVCPSVLLEGLFPPGAVVAELHGEGDPNGLLPAELPYLAKSVPKRLREFAAGRACARRALLQLGQSPVEIPMAKDRQPVWPAAFVGSITHTAGFCAAVAAPAELLLAVGIDTETLSQVKGNLWPTICTARELAWIESLPATERQAAAAVLFCAKEAFYKCQYPLCLEWLNFHDLECSVDWHGGEGALQINPVRTIGFAAHTSLPLGARYRLHDPFVTAAVAVNRH